MNDSTIWIHHYKGRFVPDIHLIIHVNAYERMLSVNHKYDLAELEVDWTGDQP